MSRPDRRELLQAAYDRYDAALVAADQQALVAARIDLTLRLMQVGETLPPRVAEQLRKDARALVDGTEPLSER